MHDSQEQFKKKKSSWQEEAYIFLKSYTFYARSQHQDTDAPLRENLYDKDVNLVFILQSPEFYFNLTSHHRFTRCLKCQFRRHGRRQMRLKPLKPSLLSPLAG